MKYLLFVLLSQASVAEWTDPHNMNPEYIKTNSDVYNPVGISTKDCNCTNYKDYEIGIIYLKRIVGLLATSKVSIDDHTSALKGSYVFDKEEDFIFLKKFSTSEQIDQNLLRQLETILNSAFHKTTSYEFVDILVTSSQNFTHLFDNRAVIYLGVIISLYILYHLLKSKFSFSYILKYFLFILWIIDYGYRYQALIEVSLFYLCTR